MPNEPTIQHWLVAVARAAGLDPDRKLDVATDLPVAGAWDRVAMSVGVTPERLADLVGAHYRLPVADFDEANPHALRLIPGSVSHRLGVFPLAYTDRALSVATADPVSLESELELSRIADRAVTFEVAPPEALAKRVNDAYPADAEPPRHEIPPLSPEAKGGPRVLVVDDDPGMRVLLRTALEAEGFRVAEAGDGPEALTLLADREDPFHLITLDLRMEEMGGLEVLKQVRSRVPTAGIPVVVATAVGDPAVEMELFEAGADDYVVKPVDPPRFLLRVKAVLRRRGALPFP